MGIQDWVVVGLVASLLIMGGGGECPPPFRQGLLRHRRVRRRLFRLPAGLQRKKVLKHAAVSHRRQSFCLTGAAVSDIIKEAFSLSVF